jgi:hypothetical protein
VGGEGDLAEEPVGAGEEGGQREVGEGAEEGVEV